MKTIKLHQIAALVLSLLFGATAMAAQTTTTFSAGSPYLADPQHEYVQDATSEAIGTVNMVLCIVNAMNINDSGMLNVGPYVALIDMNKCDSKGSSGGSSSGSSGATAAVNYMTAVVDATRASDTAPMIANVWMSMSEEGRNQNIYVKLTATTPPSAALPYGVFRLDFLGKNENGVMQMNGFIDSSSGSLQYYETGPNSSNVSLNMAASTTDSGNGIMTLGVSNWNPTALTYNFNYNATHFRRSDTANDQCFTRTKADAKRSVWRYGTYTDTAAGTRVDQANPSFQLSGTFGADSFYGYAGYWGIGFQGLDLNGAAVTSATNPTTGLISGLVVTDQRPGHTTETYSLSKVGGKLTKWTQNTTPLSAMDGIPINFWGNLDAYTSPALTSGFGSWQIQWDNANSRFNVLGTQSCGSTGCSLAPIAATITTAAFDDIPISGWSDSFGGNINIPSAATRTGSTIVSYFSQSNVTPGTALPTLHCLNRCPDAAAVNAVNAYATGAAPSPYLAVTESQWFMTDNIAKTVDYTFDGGGLKNAGTAMVVSNATFFNPDVNTDSSHRFGVQSGRLFVTAFDISSCPPGASVGSVCEPSNPAEYYTWTTGTDQWNQSMWLTRTNGAVGEIAAFDPPLNAQYAVPNTPSIYGGLAGKTIQLQFNGFGNLYGIPGHCVSPVDNSVVDCNTPNVRYVPAFSILDGETMTLNTTPTPTQLVVKALDSELRLSDLGVVGTDAAATTACSGLPLTTTLVPPTGGAHDVSPGGAYYIGAKPTVTTAPKVIDGVVQY